jgi:integrase
MPTIPDMRSVPFDSRSPVVVDGSLTDTKLTDLLALGHEYEELDYKRKIDPGSKRDEVELAKDVGAFQVLGGYIVLGVDDRGKPTGDMDGADRGQFDEARLVPKLLKYLPEPLRITTRFFERDGHDIALMWIQPSPRGYAIFTRDAQSDKDKLAAGQIYFRNGTRSVPISTEKLETIIEWRIAKGIEADALQEPLDIAVARFLREAGPARNWTQRTAEDYAVFFGKLVAQYPERFVSDFDAGSGGTELLRRFIDANWRARSASTRRTKIRMLQSFFSWAWQQRLLRRDPARELPVPERSHAPRPVPTDTQIAALIAAQDYVPDRVALALMGRVGLKKGELRLVRYGDFDLNDETVRVPATARTKARRVKIEDPDLLDDLKLMRVSEQRSRGEYILHPRVVGNLRGQEGVVHEKRKKPLQPSSIHRWFQRCVERSPSVSHITMDGLRLAATQTHRS